jgi:ATP-dependent Clp protease protease subunit
MTKSKNPLIYEKTANGEETYDIYSRLLKDRIVFLGEEITIESSNDIVSQLLWLDIQADDPIHMYINSPGGEVAGAFAIYDVMQNINSPVHTIVIGEAASAAAIILAAGAPDNRFALPNSEIMLHEPWGGSSMGSCTDLEIQSKWMTETKIKLVTILARHCGQTYEKAYKDCQRDYYMSAQEALGYGIIDNIKEPVKKIPELKRMKVKNKK